MEIGLREWLIIGGAVVVLLIVVDGWRRMTGTRNQLRMDIEKQPTEVVQEVVDDYNPELPNGGARRIASDDGIDAGTAVPESEMPAPEIVADHAVAETTTAEADTVEQLEAVVLAAPSDDMTLAAEALRTDDQLNDAVLADTSVDTVVEPVACTDDDSRVEPTFDAAMFAVDTPAVKPHAEMTSAETLAETDVAETAESAAREMVVEEEIMTSAALFEAIEQSRKVRLADFEALDNELTPRDADVIPATEALDVADATLAESSNDEPAEPAIRPDPLLRPAELDSTLIAPEPVEPPAELIVATDDALLDDPLMAGLDEPEQFYTDERIEPAVAEPVMGALTVEDEQEPAFDIEALVPEQSVSTAEPEHAPVAEPADEPRFIADIAAQTLPQSAEVAVEYEETTLELPAEFAPTVREPADVIPLADAAGARSATVVAFPDKTRQDETASAAEPVEATEAVAGTMDVTTADLETDALADGPDVTVKGGSLRQQPDPENVLVMTVVSHDATGFDGDTLLQLVLACGMRFGEMDIFHRFEDGIDTGAVQFSMANATGNGIFDVNAMNNLHTRAVSFFMSMEEPREVMNAFECMLATAETVARHLNGELVDENRLLMRPQTQEHYRQRVRDFEMRNLRRRSG